MKIIIGFLAVIFLVPSFSSLIEKLINVMFENISEIYSLLT
jgi:flagellar biosynthesis protein FliR